MNWRAVFAIVWKDLTVVARNRAVVIPLVLVPLLLLIAIPALSALAPEFINMPGLATGNIELFLSRMPEGLRQTLDPFEGEQKLIVALLLYFFAPMYLIIPLMVSSVIAADSFAGEKERRTLEALLYTPTTDFELLMGKLLSAWLHSVAIAWLGVAVYSLVANIATGSLLGQALLPNTMWIVLAVWVAPAVAGLGLGVTVFISMKVSGFQEAYQLGGVVVLPIIALVVAQAAGVMYFSTSLVALLGLALWVINAILIALGASSLHRSELVSRL